LQERLADPSDARKGLRDLLVLVDIQLSLMQVELGRHLAELQTKVLPFIEQYQSLRERCDSAFTALQARASYLEICCLPHRRPHEVVVRRHAESEEFLALHQSLKAMGRAYCRHRVALLRRNNCC
jgi:hypothetical protein